MWDVLTKDNPLVKDHKNFYIWLKTLTSDVIKDGKTIMLKEDLFTFFKEKINSDDTDFEHLSIEGYHWI